MSLMLNIRAKGVTSSQILQSTRKNLTFKIYQMSTVIDNVRSTFLLRLNIDTIFFIFFFYGLVYLIKIVNYARVSTYVLKKVEIS